MCRYYASHTCMAGSAPGFDRRESPLANRAWGLPWQLSAWVVKMLQTFWVSDIAGRAVERCLTQGV